MTTALDIIKGSLRRITSYQSGETIAAPDTQDCLDTLNDLLDSWSTDEFHIPGVIENIVNWTAGKNEYKVGNPKCTDIGFQPFSGTLTSGSNIITGATNIPSNLVVGATLTSLQNLIPTTTATTVTAIGVNTVTMSANASANSTGTDTITYTIPGDFTPSFPRPLMITSGFTRFNNLDFPLDVHESQQEYISILYKVQPGPWPTVAWYNNQYPYGILKVYQTPGNNAELHLFTKVIFANLTATSPLILPQGYARALKWCLARELWVEYVNPIAVPVMLEKLAMEALKFIKDLNAKPAQRAKYDRALVRGNRADGGWIFYGGYR